MPTIKDVARQAGVSVTTVSRVLNQRGYISSEMYQRVETAMRELNFRPNELARSLLRQSSRLIGVLVPVIDNPFFSEVVSELIRAATARGYKIILYCSQSDTANTVHDYVSMLRANQVDGIILCLHTRDIDEKLDGMPVVSFERYRLEKLPTVSCDNRAGGELAARELLTCGCKHPLMVGTWNDPWMPAYERYTAFCDVMREAGMDYELVNSEEDEHTLTDYKRLAKTVFRRHPQADGIFCTSDHLASYIVQEAVSIGRCVPEDLKVVGFNDNSFASMLNPPLTSVRQPLAQMCEAALELLIRQINGESVPTETVLPVTLSVRGSTRKQQKENSTC